MFSRVFCLMLCTAWFNCHAVQAQQPRITWDSVSLLSDGHRLMPVMGEIHYSRLPENEWTSEVQKMKEGGVSIVSTYVFWNHVEELENQYDWSGQRNLRHFLEICQNEELPVILRIGPFCHGEVRCGGIPDWIFSKECITRTEEQNFMYYTERFFRQIYTQVQGMQWKDGGPVIAIQFDNEFGGKGSYLTTLKRIALNIGFDLPFYTRTAWPDLLTPIPFGEMIPLYGDYADGFWDRSIQETVGDYYKAFNFKSYRSSTAIATEQLGSQDIKTSKVDETYPYFTCELGGGMMPSYHRRIYIYPEDAYSMAVVKLGSGSNLLGYYMYHGGTNPQGHVTTLNEHQRTPETNYNDLPVMNYDFQAPLGEFGQRNPHYFMLRKLHIFMHDFGEMLAPMPASFPCHQDLAKGDDYALRWSYRALGDSGFVFVNNYERLQKLSDKKLVRFQVGNVTFPERPITIPSGTICIFPVNICGIDYATAQPVAMRDGRIYLQKIPGIKAEICVNGKVMKNVKPLGIERPVYRNIYLLDSDTAGHLFLKAEAYQDRSCEKISFHKVREADKQRNIPIGIQGVAEEPTDEDFEYAARYTIDLPDSLGRRLMRIDYRGDVARLYANGKLIDDNFYNGRPFLYGLWRLPMDCRQLELRILPLQENMPVYFPREADASTEGEVVNAISIEPMY